jgi:hypothetical protein
MLRVSESTAPGTRALHASLKDDTTNMNDRNEHKLTGQMNHQAAGPKANASVFLFFPNAHFFKTNKRSDSRAPLENKLYQRVILASRSSKVHRHPKKILNSLVKWHNLSRKSGIWFLPDTQADPSQKI